MDGILSLSAEMSSFIAAHCTYLAQSILHLGEVRFPLEVGRHHPREHFGEDVGEAEDDDAGDGLLDVHVHVVPVCICGGPPAEASDEERHEQDGREKPEEMFLQANMDINKISIECDS